MSSSKDTFAALFETWEALRQPPELPTTCANFLVLDFDRLRHFPKKKPTNSVLDAYSPPGIRIEVSTAVPPNEIWAWYPDGKVERFKLPED